MTQILIRNIPEDVKSRLKRRAVARGVSLEAEVRDILSATADVTGPATKSSKHGVVAALLRSQAENPIDDKTWAEFEKNLRNVRKNARMRPVDLGE